MYMCICTYILCVYVCIYMCVCVYDGGPQALLEAMEQQSVSVAKAGAVEPLIINDITNGKWLRMMASAEYSKQRIRTEHTQDVYPTSPSTQDSVILDTIIF